MLRDFSLTMNPNQRWRLKNPEKARAHWIVADAIRRGKLQKKPCCLCGTPKAIAHHHDYSKPLHAHWLCQPCHRKLHAIEKGQAVGGKHKPKYAGELWPHKKKYQPAPKRDFSLSKAKEMRLAGMSYRGIGKVLNFSEGQIYKWLNPKQYH